MFNTQKESFPEKEEKVLSFWKKNNTFEKSVDQRKKGKLFSFYDGPPFATGLPHYGHLLAGTIKDVIPRYKTMKGYYVPRRFGWDCHGLPVENEIEKQEKLYGAKAIKEYGIAHFNEKCADIVLRYTSEWEKTVTRMGRWVDFSNTYRTMDISFMESVWWAFKQLFDKGLVYQGYKSMPYSPKLGTPLSNFEANLNYKDVHDPSVTLSFASDNEENLFYLAWTTTPWTLVSNLALAVNPEIDYVKIFDHATKRNYILAQSRLNQYFADGTYDLLKTFKGADLIGQKYEPLFPFFKERKEMGAFRILSGDFVSIEDGTGIVHIAPYGEIDFEVCKKEKIELVDPIDDNGFFKNDIPPYAGLYIKDADKHIMKDLKDQKKLFHQGQVYHRYPFCWRSDTPLIYKPIKTWFVKVESIKEDLINANKEIHWVPEHIKEGRFGKWLENARDWAISRNRYWGTPIPIWMSEDGDIKVFGSIEELEKITKTKITNLHRQFIDPLTFEHQGKKYTRVPEVFDCWFESGSMPYAQNHYPFENEKLFKEGFPADFIAEGLDQTRGWFYTLTVLSSALFKKPAFKNVIVNGIILAADGNKMSKRLKNYPDPDIVIQKYGADAIRLYMMHSPAVTAGDLCFSTEGVELIIRQALLPLWNSYFFFATYANIYNFKPKSFPFQKPKEGIDRWILSCMNKMILETTKNMENYELDKAIDPILAFIDQLTNWYIRRNRGRFWADEDTQDRREAFETLYTVLITLCKSVAPFIPFLAESIYQELKLAGMEDSIHLCDYPVVDSTMRDIELEKEMEYISKVVTLGHALRKEHKIKVRQPLKKAFIISANEKIFPYLEKQKYLIAEELNVKEIEFKKEEKEFIEILIKPNWRVLGKKVGKYMPLIQKKLSALSDAEMKILQEKKPLKIKVEDQEFTLTDEDVAIERKVKESIAALSDQEIAVALDTTLNDDLILEGIAREIVNKVNTMRKEKDLDIVDRIELTMETTPLVKKAYEKHKDYISNEILAVKVTFATVEGEEIDLNGEKTKLFIKKVAKG
jgi:isoleucyl-tRNA synthetase